MASASTLVAHAAPGSSVIVPPAEAPQSDVPAADAKSSRLVHVLSIGLNAGTQGLVPLRYADDDAVRIAELLSRRSPDAQVALHSLFDDETARKHPEWAERVQAPTLHGVMASAERIAQAVDVAAARGQRSEVLVWLSGHGAYDDNGEAYVPLDGERLTAQGLKALIEPLTRAHRVHVVVDTCFAAALVQSRASVRPSTTQAVDRAFDVASLRQFANVGLLLGASSTTESLEWERVQGGVFSALVRSALRGVADADDDDIVTYTELAGFLAAARLGLQKEGADQAFTVFPPRTAPSASFARRSWLGENGETLGDLPVAFAASAPFLLFDARGEFVAGGHPEPDAKQAVWLPKGDYFAVTADGEQAVRIAERASWGPAPPSTTAQRGRLDEALSRGLFQQPFGQRFMAGYQAQAGASSPAPSATESPATDGTAYWAWSVGFGLASIAAGVVAASGTVLFFATDRQVPALAGLGVGAAAGVVALVAAAGAAGVLVVGWAAE